jgi:transaldolase
MSNQVDSKIIETMYKKIPDFRRAYDEDGMQVDEFDDYGASVRTLRGFITSAHDLMGEVRDFMLPNPDVKRLETVKA